MIDFPYVDLSTNGTAAVALVVPGAAPGVGRRPRWSLDRFRPLAHRLRPAGDLVREESRRFVAPVAALSAVSAAATAASPLLLSWPLLLVALTPRLPFLVLAAAEVPLLPFLAVATIRLALVDPWYFALGRRRGPAVVELLGVPGGPSVWRPVPPGCWSSPAPSGATWCWPVPAHPAGG